MHVLYSPGGPVLTEHWGGPGGWAGPNSTTLYLALAKSLFGPQSPHLQNERVAFYW